MTRRKAHRIVITGGAAFVERTSDRLREVGADVVTAADADELFTLVVRRNPTAVVLPVDGTRESGHLTCAKLRLTRPKLRVVLVGEPTPRVERFARFVGAEFATAADAALTLS